MSPQSKFERKWKNLMKKWKPMFRKFLRGHGSDFSPRRRQRVTRNSGGITLKISKWVFYHEFFWSRAFQIYHHIWNQMSKKQDNVICSFWSITKLEVEKSQPVEPKISKWVFAHVFPSAHRAQKTWQNRI